MKGRNVVVYYVVALDQPMLFPGEVNWAINRWGVVVSIDVCR